MKTLLVLLQFAIGSVIFAQDTVSHFAILKTDYAQGTFKIVYPNCQQEDLVPILKLNPDLDIALPAKAREASDKITFRCLEYMDAKGYELLSFSADPYFRTLITENSSFYREYIFRKKGK